jgi:hypothetical protein
VKYFYRNPIKKFFPVKPIKILWKNLFPAGLRISYKKVFPGES